MKKLLFIPLIVFSNECINCHKENYIKCKKSNHYTLKNVINITRKAWGIKNSNISLQNYPIEVKKISKISDLVDDFLQRKCLRCHLTSKFINKSNNLCLSCHNKHKNNSKVKTPTKKCLKCHNTNFVGIDFLGLFPKDFDKAYKAPITKGGYYPKKIYNGYYHHLIPDIHYKKNFSCISCHKGKNWEHISCKDCHKVSKKNHKPYHKNISCIACHSSWGVNSYELNILRDDTKNYKQWKRLTYQEDVFLEKFLKKVLNSKYTQNPKMPNYITNKLELGIWYSGYKFRRWENFYLINSKNKITLARPLFQYRISYKNKDNKIIFNDINKINNQKIEAFVPYYPHTIIKEAKSCQMCHNNEILLNNNLINKSIFKGKVYNGRDLTKKQLKKLNSNKYKKEFFKFLE